MFQMPPDAGPIQLTQQLPFWARSLDATCEVSSTLRFTEHNRITLLPPFLDVKLLLFVPSGACEIGLVELARRAMASSTVENSEN